MKPSLEVLEFPNPHKSFNYFSVGVACFQPFWHYHPELELTLIKKGQGIRFVGDSILPFYDFDLVLVGENVPHHWVSGKEKGGSLQQAFVFQFPRTIFSSISECDSLHEFFTEAKRGIQFTDPDPGLIQTIETFGTLDRLQQAASLMSILNTLQHDTRRISLSTIAYTSAPLKNNAQTKINETISYILEHLDRKLTVQMLAEHTAMVPQSFCRWFKKETGNSFVTFLNRSRIENACQLLLSTDIPIQEAAYLSGFDSLSHFNRTFKNQKGMSPRCFKTQKANPFNNAVP